MENEKISIIVPVYNVQKYLDKCLESIVRQTYKNIEILLIDDGSADQSPAICDAWAEKDARIKVLHLENGGVSRARNAGLDNASGEYIAFVDSDDLICPDFCFRMWKAMADTGADLSICNEITFTDGEEPDVKKCGSAAVKEESQEDYLNHFIAPNTEIVGWVWNKLYKKSMIADLRFIPDRIIEDLMFNAQFALRTRKVVWLNEGMYYYRVKNSGYMCGGHADITLHCIKALQQNIDTFQKAPGNFYKRYETYALNKMAIHLSRADILKHFDSEREGRKIYLGCYKMYHSDIEGMNEKAKIILARYCWPAYNKLKRKKIIETML